MYFPKTQVITDLYTNGNEYMTSNNNQVYVGYYWETSFGEKFTGKNPQEANPIALLNIRFETEQISPRGTQTVETRDVRFAFPNYTYSKLKNVSPEEVQAVYPPFFYPRPTVQDYQVGQFLRFFTKNISSNQYTEINEQDYNSLIQKDAKYLFNSLIYFQLPWQLTGNQQMVFETNRKVVLNTEKQLGIIGLGLFLKENYTKFYR